MYIETTGHIISPKFVEFWQQSGGRAVLGYPLSEELEELCEDNVNRPVQYFESAVLEHHADADPAWQVIGRHVGKTEMARVYGADGHSSFAPISGDGVGGRFVAETSHSLDGPFRAFYEANGEVRVLGYPLSEAHFETCADGVARQVQYFERTVLVYHDDTTPAEIRPRALGPAEIASTYGSNPETLPPFQARNADGSVAAVVTMTTSDSAASDTSATDVPASFNPFDQSSGPSSN